MPRIEAEGSAVAPALTQKKPRRVDRSGCTFYAIHHGALYHFTRSIMGKQKSLGFVLEGGVPGGLAAFAVSHLRERETATSPLDSSGLKGIKFGMFVVWACAAFFFLFHSGQAHGHHNHSSPELQRWIDKAHSINEVQCPINEYPRSLRISPKRPGGGRVGVRTALPDEGSHVGTTR